MKYYIEFDQHKVEVNIYGKSGRTLILLSGWTHDFQYEKLFINELTKKNKVIAISYPGYSKSDENQNAQSINFLASLVDSVIKDLNLDDFILVGFSFGCQIALEYLKIHRNQKAILISPVMHLLSEDAPWFGKIILNSNFLIKLIRKSEHIKSYLVNMANSQISIITEGLKKQSKFEGNYVSLNGAFDTLIATTRYFNNPIKYKDRVKFIFGENEMGRDILEKKKIKYYILKNSGHGSFNTHYELIANLISK